MQTEEINVRGNKGLPKSVTEMKLFPVPKSGREKMPLIVLLIITQSKEDVIL